MFVTATQVGGCANADQEERCKLFLSQQGIAKMRFKWEIIYFVHDRPWISPWIKSISNELDIAIHVIASQLSCHCDVIGNRLWRHQQNENCVSETRERCVKIIVLSSFMESFCCVRNKIMYVLSWWTISLLTRVLFWCLFPSLLRNSENKLQNKPFVNAETVRHSNIHYSIYTLQAFTHKTDLNKSTQYLWDICVLIIMESWHCSAGISIL